MQSLKTLCLSAFLLIGTALFAQKEVMVSEGNATMSLGERTGFTITLDKVSEKETIKALKTWVGEMQKKADIEESAKHELKVTSFVNAQLSPDPINIYFLFTEYSDYIKVTGFFEMNLTFVSTSTLPDKVEPCKNFMRRFALRIEKMAVQEQLVAAQKELDKRNDEQAALEKKNKQLNELIKESEETIAKAKADLEQNGKDQDGKKSEIAKQKAANEAIEQKLKEYEQY
ncbi:MAG: hypothetical protein IPI65_10225 [Bacteroidetes bacterium]|nr:hypothetical protein [Bacteroidota bacterium]